MHAQADNNDEFFTSHPSNPKAAASSAKRSAYICEDSLVDSISLQIAFPSSHSVMKVPSTYDIKCTTNKVQIQVPSVVQFETSYNTDAMASSTHYDQTMTTK